MTQPFDPQQLIVDLRDVCGIDAECIGQLIGLSGAQVRNLAAGRRTRMDYEHGRRLVELHAECMTSPPPSAPTATD
jgi:hypothetical protein